MHDLGIIPEGARGWRYLPAPAGAGSRWRRRGFRDDAWLVGDAPFHLDRETGDQLAQRRPATAPAGAPLAVDFRYEFHLTREMLRGKAQFKLEVVSQAPAVAVWVNDQEVTAEGKPRRGRYEYTLPQKLTVNGTPTEKELRLYAGANVLAVQVTLAAAAPGAPPLPASDVLLQARLDEVRRPEVPAEVDEHIAEEITEKLVTQRAVVCDLCSAQFGQVPACVNACPHEAALRVDARFEFPVG
jgi:hypothetical protein